MKALGVLLILVGCLMFVDNIVKLPPNSPGPLETPEAWGFYLGTFLPSLVIVGLGLVAIPRKKTPPPP
jgi:hypothetical protein